ncbi:MAG: VCBS repeat-containing protein [Deltaproteobacteria bacterium]|nr:VCBS repeat-containing protein [Deltaproteobacteria bacterium]
MRILALLSIGMWAVTVTGCGGGKATTCESGCSGDETDGGDDSGPTGVDGGVEEGCRGDLDCAGGFCIDGACCPTPECGGECCTGDEICFAGACVVPGEHCRSSRECGEDRYCEPALVDDPEDLPEPVGEDCLHEPPPEGRCLDLPPVCDEEDPGDDAECLPRCEYHPPVGALEAVTEWRWGPVAAEQPELTDVWATPTVGRLVDSNCDGAVDELDPPNVVFVSGNARSTCCSCGGYAPSTCLTGVLRVLDGLTGEEVWSLERAAEGSIGFAGLSVALGDIDADGRVDIAAVTGEGKIVVVDATGAVMLESDLPVAGIGVASFGWGGGLAIADMDGDGAPEIAYGASLFTTAGGALTRLFVGASGLGGGAAMALSVFGNVDADPDVELVAGKTVYDRDGTMVWDRPGLSEGFPAVGDLDGDGAPEVVLIGGGQALILEGATGATELGPLTLPGTGSGGPPTIADFDGDGAAEIGVAQANYYSVLEADYAAPALRVLWQAPNHDLSSSVTGSTVFDFEGDGIAEVVYNDECFLWVYDGPTGEVRFATPTTSFTATEASLVADVDGDGHAEIVMVSNGANPGPGGWGCDVAPWNQPDPNSVRPAWAPPPGQPAYRGITVLGDASSAWVGTRTLWNQHSYHVSNICDDRDDACDVAANTYGAIPARERANWQVPWLNNFRQNAQDEGIFDAPDATVTLDVGCESPPILRATVRNLGQALLPAGVEVAFWLRLDDHDELLGTAATEAPLFAGQVAELEMEAPADPSGLFMAQIVLDPDVPAFRQCREDNDGSGNVSARCVF